MIIIQNPMNIRVDLDKTTVGTLVVTEQGLGFKIPRGKRKSDTVIPWDKIPQAFDILKNVPGFTIPNDIDDGALDVEFDAGYDNSGGRG